MGDAKTFVDAILGFVIDAVAPVAEALEDPEALVGLLKDLGWTPTAAPPSGAAGGALPIGQLVMTARNELATLRGKKDPSEEDLVPLVSAVSGLAAALATA